MPPINGMLRAARALHHYERRQEVLSHNLANVETNGFKAERVFAQALGDALPVTNASTDRSAGTLQQTDSPFDLALARDGFFSVQTAEGVRWTRSGSFRLDEAGQVVDARGNALLTDQGPITVQKGQRFGVDERGNVAVDGKIVGRLRLETAPAGANLTHAGENLLVPDPAAAPLAEADTLIKQGYLETSNVNTVSSLVEMIEVQRAYQAVQKTIITMDQTRETASTKLGQPI